MTCRYDRERDAYLNDGEPCQVDEYGDPTHHCTARRTCAQHIGPDELTCARCLGRTRVNLRRIPALAALMPEAAVEAGVESEAANLAGPATDPAEWAERRIAMRGHLDTWERLGRISEAQWARARLAMEDDDEDHPYNLLGRWDMMIREDYDHPSDEPVTITNAADYLDRQLGRIAQDSGQDFPLFAREIRHCVQHMEAVLATARLKQRGAPCPECVAARVDKPERLRLQRVYGHWCADPDCERFHFSTVLDGNTGDLVPDTSGDWWVCPRNRDEHRWSHEDYERWIEERHAYNRDTA